MGGLILLGLLLGCSKKAPSRSWPLAFGALKIGGTAPKPGEKLSIRYFVAKSPLKRASVIHAVCYGLVGRKAYAHEVALKMRDGVLEGHFIAPDSAQALVFSFKSAYDRDDNGGKGYIIPLYDQDKAVLPGALASIGNFYLELAPSLTSIRHDRADALAMIGADIAQHPQLEKRWKDQYRMQRYRYEPTQGRKGVEEEIHALEGEKDLDESALLRLRSLYETLHQRARSDSIEQLLVKRFPHGKTASKKALEEIIHAEDLKAATALYKRYEKRFDTLSGPFRDYAALDLAMRYAKSGKTDQSIAFAMTIQDNLPLIKLASYYNNTAWPMAEKGKALKRAEKLSKTALWCIEKAIEQAADRPSFITARDWKDKMQAYQASFSDTHALILFKQGKTEAAIAQQSQIAGLHSSPEINQRYIRFLLADRRYKQLRSLAERYLAAGVGTPQMEVFLKQAYQRSGQPLKAYKAFIEKLRGEKEKQLMATLKGQMLDKPAPDFTLKDLQGNSVSLASLKGKVVVLDFWATWCGPCKMSFPGMQKAVEQYKGDDKVAFLFVNTWERSSGVARERQISDFIKKSGYQLRVLMDKRNAQQGGFQVVSAYGVRGIPTKFIIGPKGHIRFAHSGYEGSQSALLEQLNAMIALAKGQG